MEYFKEIMIFLTGVIAGGGALTLFNFTSSRKNKSGNSKVTMKNVSAKGDVAGRDINKK